MGQVNPKNVKFIKYDKARMNEYIQWLVKKTDYKLIDILSKSAIKNDTQEVYYYTVILQNNTDCQVTVKMGFITENEKTWILGITLFEYFFE